MDIQGFVIAILPIALSPGASFTLALSNVAINGMKGAFKVLIGTGLGIILHGLLVGLGISNVLNKSQVVMNSLQIIGIAFLLWLGLKLVTSGMKLLHHKMEFTASDVSVKQAFLLNIFNAKAIVLYLTVVPIFAGSSLSSYLLLATTHVIIMALWILIFSLMFCFAKEKLKVNIISAIINIVGGGCLLTMSCHSALNYYYQ
ncbi:LysE family translocator [Marinomonas rhizomae]|uniref:Threonine/homoserine/homoserine lactone efflux protein n=1 Tax=Marinomonas rhizomae TaxID=491948 RepID=A0A366IY89_9GAMM|nr:LysE family translocator [Marinomonas rhizomae]RBP79547.1 threonine/homoserine/homoserine lactone efflux protein [Marinomonas rhizomae]RNF71552.1 LysE family translocator [Marinomonas rhizomae]